MSKQTMPPSAGRLLVSEPFLHDPNFKRTVILLCEYNDKGCFGFILNRNLDIFITDVMEINTILEIPLYIGGPVQKDTLHFIHKDASLASTSIEIGKGYYWGGNFDIVKERIENNTLNIEDFRFFVGYSGWGEGQLEAEINSKSWYVSETNVDLVFEKDNALLWKNILKNMGGEFRYLANAPESPQMN